MPQNQVKGLSFGSSICQEDNPNSNNGKMPLAVVSSFDNRLSKIEIEIETAFLIVGF